MNIFIWFSSYRYSSVFNRMMVLLMTPCLSDEIRSIFFQNSYNFFKFHSVFYLLQSFKANTKLRKIYRLYNNINRFIYKYSVHDFVSGHLFYNASNLIYLFLNDIFHYFKTISFFTALKSPETSS